MLSQYGNNTSCHWYCRMVWVSGGQEETTQLGRLSLGPPAGRPDMVHTFLIPISPAMRRVSLRHSLCTGSVGCKGLPLALRLMISSSRSANASANALRAAALDFIVARSKCGAVDQPPVLTSMPATPSVTAASSSSVKDRPPRLSDTKPSFMCKFPLKLCSSV